MNNQETTQILKQLGKSPFRAGFAYGEYTIGGRGEPFVEVRNAWGMYAGQTDRITTWDEWVNTFEKKYCGDFSQWLPPDTLAILCTAIYYGVPSQGHASCYKAMIAGRHYRHEQVSDPGKIQGKYCIECDKPLLLV